MAPKFLVLAALVALGAMLAGGSASAQDATDSQQIEIVLGKKGFPKFDVGDGTIAPGGELTIVNKTDPRRIGPHTASLVPANLIPRSTPDRRGCFDPGEICLAIAKWHGSNGNSPPTKNHVDVGEKGWDTQGDLKETGDTVFLTDKGEEFVQTVSAPEPRTIHFICAIHPGMNGKLKVESPPAE